MSGNSRSEKDGNPVVLSYNNSLLRKKDVELLKGPYWINDTIIGFYFEYLDETTTNSVVKELLFVSPELTQLLKLTASSDYGMLLGSINAKSSSFVFFPLNNCDSRESAGGSHWSLLVYSKPEKTCFHFDSSKGLNSDVAKDFAKSITDYFCPDGLWSYLEIDTPQQENGYDCGLYVLCNTDLVSNHAVAHSKIKNCTFGGLKSLADGKRGKILELIDDFRKTESDGSDFYDNLA